MAAQTFNRWSRLGVWERLLERAQQRDGIKLGMAFLDGTELWWNLGDALIRRRFVLAFR
jgi:hypothetical protein